MEDLSSLRAVLASRETLYPVDEASVARAAEQIAAARATLARLPEYERALEELEGRALARPLPGTQRLPQGWRFR